VVPHEVEPWRRDERGELFDQLQRLERHVRRAVSPAMAKFVWQAAVGQLAQPLRCQRIPQSRNARSSTLDEAWDAPFLDARVAEPGLQMMCWTTP